MRAFWTCNTPYSSIGPSHVFEVDMILEDEFAGASYAAGFKSDILVVDFSDDVLNYLREYDPVTDSTEVVHGFHDVHTQAIPSPSDLLAMVLSWAESEVLPCVQFYSAREEPRVKTPQTPKKAPAKRLTNAALAVQVSQLSAQVSLLVAQQSKAVQNAGNPQVVGLTNAARVTEPGVLAPTGPVPKMPPVSQGLQAPGPPRAPAIALQLLGPPPKTRTSPLTSGPGLFEEPYDPIQAPPNTPEQILSQQSVALNALVSHLIQGGDSIGLDLPSGGASSSSTRGTAKREKLQQDLAARQSTFFMALQQQIFRRLHPSTVIPRTEEELQKRSPSLLTYLERYGGFKGEREAGLTMWVFAHALDAAAAGDFYATKEYLALGVMAVEQSAFDAGDWGLAYVLSLIEDPPQVLFQDRMQSITSAGRPFAHLIPPQLASINLAYLKEIDILQTRRQETKSKKNQSGAQETEENSPSPKRRPKFPKKPKGGGDSQQ